MTRPVLTCSCLGWQISTGFRNKVEDFEGWKFCPYCGQELRPRCTSVLEEGDHIIYGSQFAEYRELLRRGLYFGILTVTLDYNRSGWETSSPEDCVIFRVRAKPSSEHLRQVLSERLDESVGFHELDRLGEASGSD